ncbi:hypothetical protein Hanom_Chr02g00159111 [Helianthus anomalus]
MSILKHFVFVPFRDDYYQKAIYHRISEPPKVNQKQTGESSSKIRQQAMAVIHEDEGFNWSKYISREEHALVAEVEQTNGRWDAERECYLDPQGNPVVDPKKVDFNAATAVSLTCQTFYTRRSIEKDYEANLYKRLKEVFYVSLPKVMELNKKKEENVEKLVEELKKTAGDADENQQKVDEDQKKTTSETTEEDQNELNTQLNLPSRQIMMKMLDNLLITLKNSAGNACKGAEPVLRKMKT